MAQLHILLLSGGFVLLQMLLGTTPNIAPPSNLKYPVLMTEIPINSNTGRIEAGIHAFSLKEHNLSLEENY